MLVLTRAKEQSVKIGKDIVVRILGVNGRVKLGIEAPDDMIISRGEHDEEQETNKPVAQRD